jgi:purine-binding chemotaxis protein CheW
MSADNFGTIDISGGKNRQFATFYLDERLYGIDVMEVQEVTQALSLTPIKLAPNYIKGIINLRGQIATAIGLRELFGLASPDESLGRDASLVCRVDGSLLSLLVDRIGDVIEVSVHDFENTPDTIDLDLAKFMTGVYKTKESILSVIETQSLSRELNLRG